MGSKRKRPINQCIYCDHKPNRHTSLSKEHIIPQGLGGNITLLRASCKQCAKITSDFERICIRESLWVLRSLAGHKSGFRLPQTNHLAVLPVLQQPSILSSDERARNEFFRLKVLTGELSGDVPKPVEVKPSKYRLDLVSHSRLLAKIAHGFAVNRYGLSGFDSFLKPIILGEITHKPDIWHYVGGLDEPKPTKEMHKVTLEERIIRDELLIVSQVRLFSMFPTPLYEVVAGSLTKQRLIKPS